MLSYLLEISAVCLGLRLGLMFHAKPRLKASIQRPAILLLVDRSCRFALLDRRRDGMVMIGVDLIELLTQRRAVESERGDRS